MTNMLTRYVLKHFHFCCGLGGGAKGFNQNKEVVGHLQAEWRCIGGVDVDDGALRDFDRLAGVPGTQMDLFTREQYTAFCQQLQTVEDVASDLANLGAGLYLLIGLLEDGARVNVDPLVGRALRGLLQPICTDLERHADALQAASGRQSKNA